LERDVRIFLGIAAVLAWLFGLMMIFVPSPFYAPVRITLTPMLATIPQAHGATLVGLGTVNWLGRRAEGPALTAILLGNLVTQVLSFGVAVRIAKLGAGSSAAAAFAIHTILGTAFAVFLARARRASSPAGRWIGLEENDGSEQGHRCLVFSVRQSAKGRDAARSVDHTWRGFANRRVHQVADAHLQLSR
jgi:hypothetical protein